MNRQNLMFLIVIMMMPAFCFAQKVNVDFDVTADFSTYKTYQWKEGMQKAPNPLMHQRIVAAVDAQLAAKGMQQVASDPDLYVIYHGSAKDQLDINSWGYRPLWGRPSNISVQKYVVGTLVLDLLDSHREQPLVWRGIASETISDNPEKNAKNIKKAVEKMFKKFPPEKK